MSLIKFTTHVDMTTSATPSSGISMGLDLDGVLKQKNTSGVISSIGTGSGSNGTSGSSGTSGVDGNFLGSSGTSGKSGSSGTSGNGGVDGANSLRWTYGSRSNNEEFELDVSNFAEPSNIIGININNLYSDVTNWLTSIGTYVTSYPGQIYLQITQADSPDIFGIYKINNATDNSTFWSFDVDSISSNGSPTAGKDYSINWVAFGGVNGSTGSAGSSGTSGKSGSSGTSGASGTSGYSGVDGANTLKWNLDTTETASTSEKFDTAGLIDTSTITAISINKTSLNGSATNWLTTIDTVVTANPDSVYLQITKSDDATIFGIYSLTNSNNNSTHYTFGVGSVISSSGNLVEGGDHSISFIIQGAGTSGSSGSSGTSGANGSSGTSGANGSSGTSGANGSSGTSGSSGYSGTPNTTNPIISSSPFTLPISIISAEAEFYQVDTSSAITIQLPNINTGPILDGKIVYIKDVVGSASSNQITISPWDAQTIEGATASRVIAADWGLCVLIKLNAEWLLIKAP